MSAEAEPPIDFIAGVLVGGFVVFVLMGILLGGGYHRGYLDGQVSRTRCQHGAAMRVGDEVVCVVKGGGR